MASASGDSAPTAVEYVLSTSRDADLVLSGDVTSDDTGDRGATPVVALVASGHFVGHDASVPDGFPTPTGTELYEMVRLSVGFAMGWGVGNSVPNLASLGHVVVVK